MADRGQLSREALQLVAARFRVLGEPVRLEILQTLEAGPRNVSGLAAEVGTTQPNVSKHLRLLEEAGLVARRPAGNSVVCALADESVFELCDVVCHSLRERLASQAGLLQPAPRRRHRHAARAVVASRRRAS